MHKSAYDLMDAALNTVTGDGLRVLDVGSLDVNGTYRPLVEGRGWQYTGLDAREGPNVDIVAVNPFVYPFIDGHFDLVISGSTMEHVTAIWEWVDELARLVKPGGTLIIITHHAFPLHRYPVDCWRIMPDGMAYLFERAGLLEWTIETPTEIDIIGVAKK
jgi:SAM-dependent methyltransferase